MNQILITQKLYVTPELRRKKKLYRIEFFISVFLVCLLFSYYVYAEYDRTAGVEIGDEILQSFKAQETVADVAEEIDTTVRDVADDVIIVAMEAEEPEPIEIPEITEEPQQEAPATYTYTSDNGVSYTVEAELNIPRLGINHAVLSDTSPELLKIALNKYWGPKPNEIGNYCIVGHNYKSGKMFGKLNQIQMGDIVELTDGNNNTVKYSVTDRYVVEPTDVRCTSQLTNGTRELTLITCTNYGQQRLIVKAKEVK